MAIQYLVCEGGGVTGAAAAGGFQALEDTGQTANLKGVAGTSAGAILAGLVSAGYKARELTREIMDVDFSTFMDDSFGVLRDTTRLLTEFGICKGDVFYEWFVSMLEKKGFVAESSFADVAKETGIRAKVIATNLNRQKAVTLGDVQTEKRSLAWAVRASMSIPLIFRAVRSDDGEDWLVDGGCSKNYPIQEFDGEAQSPDEVVGFRLDKASEIEALSKGWERARIEVNSIVDYLPAVVNQMRAAAHMTYLTPQDLKRTIFLDTLEVGPTEFNLGPHDKRRLYQSGYACAYKWIEAKTRGGSF